MPETVACELCGARRDVQKQLFASRNWDKSNLKWEFSVVMCRSCKLIFVNPRPTLNELSAYYDENYKAYKLSLRGTMLAEEEVIKWEGKYKSIVYHQPGGRRILDVGCGDGVFLHRMQMGGWEVTGVETSNRPVEYTRSVLGLEVFNGELKAAHFASNYFDVITFWQVFEHISDPHETLQEVFRILAPGGLLIIEVPNIATPAFWFFGKHYSFLQIPFHLYFFCPSTLRRITESAGFRAEFINFSCTFDSFLFSGLLLFQELGYRLGLTSSRGKMVLDPGDLGKAIGMGEGVQGSSKGLRSSFISSVKKVVLLMFRLLGKLQQTFRIGDIIALYARKP